MPPYPGSLQGQIARKGSCQKGYESKLNTFVGISTMPWYNQSRLTYIFQPSSKFLGGTHVSRSANTSNVGAFTKNVISIHCETEIKRVTFAEAAYLFTMLINIT
jgi:hypothetical protein